MAGSHTTERQGKTGSNAVAGDLRLALRDDQLNGRKKAVEALRNVETNEALEVLKHALCDRDPRVRKDVAGILHSRSWQPKNDVEQAHYLIAQSEWDESIRLGEPAVKPLIQALGVDRAKVVEALGYIGGPVASEALIEVLQHQDWYLKCAAAESLGRTRDSRALEPLIEALKDDEHFVRGDAAKALGKLGFAKAKKPLQQVLTDEDLDVRRAAANSLDDLGWKPENDTDRAYYNIAMFHFMKCRD